MSPADGVNKSERNFMSSAASHVSGDATLEERCVMLGKWTKLYEPSTQMSDTFGTIASRIT